MKNRLRKAGAVCGVCLALASVGGAQEAESVRAFGDHLFRQGDYYRAITEYERFVFLAPEHPAAAAVRLRIGEAYYFGEKWDAAARVFRQLDAADAGPDVRRVSALYLAALALRQKDVQRSIDLLEQYLGDYPDDVWRNDVICQLILLDIQVDGGKIQRREALDQVQQIRPYL